MGTVFSHALYESLAALPPAERQPLVAALGARRRDELRFEALLLFGGLLGLHRLYLNDSAGCLARCLNAASGLTLLYTAFALLSAPVLIFALAFFALNVVLWTRDYVRRAALLAAFHGELEGKVLAFLNRRPGAPSAS